MDLNVPRHHCSMTANLSSRASINISTQKISTCQGQKGMKTILLCTKPSGFLGVHKIKKKVPFLASYGHFDDQFGRENSKCLKLHFLTILNFCAFLLFTMTYFRRQNSKRIFKKYARFVRILKISLSAKIQNGQNCIFYDFEFSRFFCHVSHYI